MGQGLAPAMGQGLTLCCAQDSCAENAPVVKATPSLRCVNAQSRNLQHPSWEVRAEAADFFGSLGAESSLLVVPVLQELLLKDESWHVRQHAAGALQDLGAEAISMAAPALQKTTQDDGRYTVRLAAAQALRKFGHRAEAALPMKSSDFGIVTTSNASTSSTSTPMMSTTTTATLSSSSLANDLEHDEGEAGQEESVSELNQFAMPYLEEPPTLNDEKEDQLADISEISMISPPREHLIVLERGPSGKWGMDVDFVVSGTCLRVSRVKEGAISLWNQEHPEATVEAGDLLVELNGVSGDSKELVKVISKADRLEMVVQKGT